MARASGIWIIKGAYGNADVIHGAFTVKWECAAWLKKVADPSNYLVERYEDGKPGLPARVPVSELLAMKTYDLRYGVLCTHLTDSGTG